MSPASGQSGTPTPPSTQFIYYLVLVIQKLDSAIHQINHYPADKYYIWKPNCGIQWIAIYLVNSIIHLLNSCDLMFYLYFRSL